MSMNLKEEAAMEEQLSKKQERSRRYPALPLEQAIASIRKIKDALGSGPYSLDHACLALNHNTASGPARRKIAALVYFGFLKLNQGGSYYLTDFAKKVLSPISDQEFETAKFEAMRRPSLFSEIINRFDGQALPKLFPNILCRDFGITEQQSEEVAEIFKSSAEYAGLLRNGVICTENNNNSNPMGGDFEEEDDADAEREEIIKPAPTTKAPLKQDVKDSEKVSEQDGMKSFEIVLGLERSATLHIPKPVRISDFDKIKRWIEFNIEMFKEEMPDTSAN